jgi:hypothetical protein
MAVNELNESSLGLKNVYDNEGEFDGDRDEREWARGDNDDVESSINRRKKLKKRAKNSKMVKSGNNQPKFTKSTPRQPKNTYSETPFARGKLNRGKLTPSEAYN